MNFLLNLGVMRGMVPTWSSISGDAEEVLKAKGMAADRLREDAAEELSGGMAPAALLPQTPLCFETATSTPRVRISHIRDLSHGGGDWATS
jgi:hypothetical protein